MQRYTWRVQHNIKSRQKRTNLHKFTEAWWNSINEEEFQCQSKSSLSATRKEVIDRCFSVVSADFLRCTDT